MKIDEIYLFWEKDSIIDRTELGDESLNTTKLHNKYIQIWSKERIQFLSLEQQYKKLYLDKHEFYSQGPSKESLELGWKYPDKGLIIKNEISMYIDADRDIINLSLRIGVQKEKIQLLESIIKQIQNRGFAIKNALEWLRFTNGG